MLVHPHYSTSSLPSQQKEEPEMRKRTWVVRSTRMLAGRMVHTHRLDCGGYIGVVNQHPTSSPRREEFSPFISRRSPDDPTIVQTIWVSDATYSSADEARAVCEAKLAEVQP